MSVNDVMVRDLAQFSEVFTLALRGHTCWARHDGGPRIELPMHRWTEAADGVDEQFLAHCTGSTLDIGCGPGRMAARLAERGHRALGLDVVEEAVRLTRARGVAAVRADVFQPVPDEGRWSTAILADGNIGIGGDPRSLLARVRALLEPEGRVVVEVEPPGAGHLRSSLVLSAAGIQTAPLGWARVGADAIGAIAHETGFALEAPPHAHGDRWCAVLLATS